VSAVYPASARVFRPWKNGGGTTAEILCWPEGAGFDDFTLRLSVARIGQSGAFSQFDGVDRILTVIEGGPVVLRMGDATHRLTPQSPPLAFAGEVPVTALLEGASVLDFNVMTRRPLQARVTVGPLSGQPRFALLLQPVGGLERLDLVDLATVRAERAADLSGAAAIAVHLPPA
jgi:uncharacterized protein